MKRLFYSLALFPALSALLLSCSTDRNSDFGNVASPIKDSAVTREALEIQRNFRAIYDLYKDRVVFISTEQVMANPLSQFFDGGGESRRSGLGTGFVLSDDGYICTNHHVIRNVDRVTVRVGGKSMQADVVGSDERTDIALLKVSAGDSLKAVFLGDSDKVRVGDIVIAIGNPFGLDKTFTMGVISATARRDIDFMGSSQSHIQTDASINPGNSGGPLINIYGEVIGINRMIYSKSGGSMGIGFAIPINTARVVLDHLKRYKRVRRGFLGVQIAPISEEIARRLNRTSTAGALVVEVMQGSPAARSGIRPGDVILRIGSRSVESYGDVIDEIGQTPVGRSLDVSIWRGGTMLNLSIRIVERP